MLHMLLMLAFLVRPSAVLLQVTCEPWLPHTMSG